MGEQINTDLIVRTLLDFGALCKPTQTKDIQSDLLFTGSPEANKLCAENPFAFLLGCQAAQHIRAEQIWDISYKLMQRLGHLDPHRMLQAPEHVYTAFTTKPMLHRYKNIMADYFLACARTVVEDYGGFAERIWNDNPTALVLQDRFRKIAGFGPKKAAMACSLLVNFLNVPVQSLDGSNIAPDIHVRRVMVRLGLAEAGRADECMRVARELFPERPEALDQPLWQIGRNWCTATKTICGECPMSAVCLFANFDHVDQWHKIIATVGTITK